MQNKLPMKISKNLKMDEAPKTKPRIDRKHEIGYDVADESLPRFELRYLNSVLNVDQF